MYRKRTLELNYGMNKKNKSDKNTKHNNDENDTSSVESNLDLSSLLKKDESKKIERDNNHIYFYSEVDRNSIYELITLIREAEEESYITSYKLMIDEIPIYLHISSFGGSVYPALNAIDFIKSCKVPVYTIIEGATASAGTLISIVGKKRYIRENGYMLIHQLSSGFWGKMDEIEDEFKNLQQLTDKIKNIYRNNTTISKKDLNELLTHDLWLDSEKCIKNGLVDELWNR